MDSPAWPNRSISDCHGDDAGGDIVGDGLDIETGQASVRGIDDLDPERRRLAQRRRTLLCPLHADEGADETREPHDHHQRDDQNELPPRQPEQLPWLLGPEQLVRDGTGMSPNGASNGGGGRFDSMMKFYRKNHRLV